MKLEDGEEDFPFDNLKDNIKNQINSIIKESGINNTISLKSGSNGPDPMYHYFIRQNESNVPNVQRIQIITKHAITAHTGEQFVDFGLHEESDGTNKLLDFLQLFGINKTSRGIILIDEIERSLHQNLTKLLVKLMFSQSNLSNQIIFTTHDTDLLDPEIFRKDQLWFVNKSRDGASELYSLSDYVYDYKVTSTQLQQDYLDGRFKAIPNLSPMI